MNLNLTYFNLTSKSVGVGGSARQSCLELVLEKINATPVFNETNLRFPWLLSMPSIHL